MTYALLATIPDDANRFVASLILLFVLILSSLLIWLCIPERTITVGDFPNLGPDTTAKLAELDAEMGRRNQRAAARGQTMKALADAKKADDDAAQELDASNKTVADMANHLTGALAHVAQPAQPVAPTETQSVPNSNPTPEHAN